MWFSKDVLLQTASLHLHHNTPRPSCPRHRTACISLMQTRVRDNLADSLLIPTLSRQSTEAPLSHPKDQVADCASLISPNTMTGFTETELRLSVNRRDVPSFIQWASPNMLRCEWGPLLVWSYSSLKLGQTDRHYRAFRVWNNVFKSQ